MMMKKFLLFATCTLLSGCCCKIGPTNLQIDSLCYNFALQNSTDAQLLLNMVRLRYRDNPMFLQVGLISTNYDYRRGSFAELEFQSNKPEFSFTPRVTADYSEKPTTTFSPLRGEGFVKEMLSPITLETLVLLDAAGWRIDRILRCCAQRMNDLENAPSASGPTPDAAPKFRKFLELTNLLRILDNQDAMRLATQKHPKTNEVCVFLVLDEHSAETDFFEKIWNLLDVESGTYNIRLTPYHGRGHKKDEVIIDMRSPLSVLYFLSQGVNVPTLDEYAGKVVVTQDDLGARFNWGEVLGDLFTVNVVDSSCLPTDPAVCVKYRNHCFYIDDRDLTAKSTFSMLSQLLALQTSTVSIPTPILTLPINE